MIDQNKFREASLTIAGNDEILIERIMAENQREVVRDRSGEGVLK